MDIVRRTEIIHTHPNESSGYPYALSQVLFDTPQLFLSSELVYPGKRSSAPHFHREQDEVIVVIKGELHAFEGEISTLVRAGDTICFRANSMQLHFLENKSDHEAEFLLFRKNRAIKSDVQY